MDNELTRLAEHVRSEQARASRRDAIREGLWRQINHVGFVKVTRHFLQECFPLPDQTENFFLASAGCRPIPALDKQVEDWRRANNLELRYCPDSHDQILLMSRSFFDQPSPPKPTKKFIYGETWNAYAPLP